jgi:hypothetical protein
MTQKILSLDGGGTWALLEAMALHAIYGDTPGWQILAEFDLAVANSGGSIVLGGLIENMTPSQILNLFDDVNSRRGIFAKAPFLETLLSHIPIFPKYSAVGKRQGLGVAFGPAGDRTMADLSRQAGWPSGPNNQPVKILIVGFDYDALRAVFFRSYNTAAGAKADQVALVDAVHASSNAPVVYFDAPALFNNRRYWDGAMGGFNNPLMAGVVDLLAEGAPAGEIVALTIGTGTVKLLPPGAPGNADANLRQAVEEQNVINDLGKAAGCITDDPPDNASYAAHVILTQARGADVTHMGPVVRLNPVIRPVRQGDNWSVPAGLEFSQFETLKGLAMDAVDQDKVDLIKVLGGAWIAGSVPNQPIRMRSDDLKAEPGDEVFADGANRWRVLSQAPP